jgi:hypothetical protein
VAKRVDCSLLVHRAHNLLKGVAEAHEHCIIKMCPCTFLDHRRGTVKCPRQVSANLPRLDHSRNHRCILTVILNTNNLSNYFLDLTSSSPTLASWQPARIAGWVGPGFWSARTRAGRVEVPQNPTQPGPCRSLTTITLLRQAGLDVLERLNVTDRQGNQRSTGRLYRHSADNRYSAG